MNEFMNNHSLKAFRNNTGGFHLQKWINNTRAVLGGQSQRDKEIGHEKRSISHETSRRTSMVSPKWLLQVQHHHQRTRTYQMGPPIHGELYIWSIRLSVPTYIANLTVVAGTVLIGPWMGHDHSQHTLWAVDKVDQLSLTACRFLSSTLP